MSKALAGVALIRNSALEYVSQYKFKSVPIRLFMFQQCSKFTKKYRITDINKPERTFTFIKDCKDFNPTLLRKIFLEVFLVDRSVLFTPVQGPSIYRIFI
jgi:hypothetical protein